MINVGAPSARRKNPEGHAGCLLVVDGQPSSRELIRAIVNMASVLGLEVIAEGIETAAPLRVLGCRRGQGYHFGGPLNPNAVEALLLNQRGPDELPSHVAPFVASLVESVQGCS